MTGTVSVQRLLRVCLGALGLALLWLLLGATDARADEARPAPAAPVLPMGVSVATHTPSTPVSGALSRVVTDVVATTTRVAAPSNGSNAHVGQQDSSSTGSPASGAGQAPRSSAPRESAPAVGRVLRASANRAAATVRTSAATVDAVVAAASAVVAPADRAGAAAGVLGGAGAVAGDLLGSVSGVLEDVPGQAQPLPVPQPPAPLHGAPVHQPSTDSAADPEVVAAPDHRLVPALLVTTPALPTGPAPDAWAAAAPVGAERAATAVRGGGGAGLPAPAPSPTPGGAPEGLVPSSAGSTHGGHSGDSPAEPGDETILDAHAAALGTAATVAEHPAPPRVPGFRPE